MPPLVGGWTGLDAEVMPDLVLDTNASHWCRDWPRLRQVNLAVSHVHADGVVGDLLHEIEPDVRLAARLDKLRPANLRQVRHRLADDADRLCVVHPLEGKAGVIAVDELELELARLGLSRCHQLRLVAGFDFASAEGLH